MVTGTTECFLPHTKSQVVCDTLTTHIIYPGLRELFYGNFPQFEGATEPQERQQTLINAFWGSSTWYSNEGLWKRYMAFSKTHQLDFSSHEVAGAFLSTTKTSYQTLLVYTRSFHSIFTKMGWKTDKLDVMASGLEKLGARTPTKQANPMTVQDLATILRDEQDEQLRMGAMITWKTASRWDEVSRMTSDSFIHLDPQEIIVYWGCETKSTSKDPFSPTTLTVITGRYTEEIYKYLTSLKKTTKGQRLFPVYNVFFKMLQSHFPGKYGAHSFKRGASDILLMGAMSGRCTLQQATLLLKHKEGISLKSITSRYFSDRVKVARFLGTQDATRLL